VGQLRRGERDAVVHTERQPQPLTQPALAGEQALRTAQERARLDNLQFIRSHIVDGGLAGLWWMGGDAGKLIQLGEQEERINAAVRLLSGDPARSQMELLADLLHEFWNDLGPEPKQTLVDRLDRIFRSHERDDLADRLRQAS
jgi:hypothetical protein